MKTLLSNRFINALVLSLTFFFMLSIAAAAQSGNDVSGQTNLVNSNVVVINKKSGQIVTGLKKENFAVFENGVEKEITAFATPDAPIAVTLVLEYSKLSEIFGLNIFGQIALSFSQFIRPQNDYASVIAFNIRPVPVTDFTNDLNRLRQSIDTLVRNKPAYNENHLFDAIAFALAGSQNDSAEVKNSGQNGSVYSGITNVQTKRHAVILFTSGIDMSSKINFTEAMQMIQNAGIPFYIINTGNCLRNRYESRLPASNGTDRSIDRFTFLQAENNMNTFAKESGGKDFPITFESELPSVLRNIDALLRNQYSITYDAGGNRIAGKRNGIVVKVDVNGDGVYDDRDFEVQYRHFYTMENKKDK